MTDKTKKLLRSMRKSTPKNPSISNEMNLPNYSGVNRFIRDGHKQGGELDLPYFKMSTGAGSGKVLTSDGSGNGTWEDPVDQGTFRWTSTAEFEDATKTFSSENYEIETEIDNPSKASNRIELGDSYGDAFTFASANSNTWKWVTMFNHGSSDINTTKTGELYMQVTGSAGAERLQMSRTSKKLTGEFDVQVDYNDLVLPSGISIYACGMYTSTASGGIANDSGILNMYNSGQIYYAQSNSGANETMFSTSDTSGKFRIKRTDMGSNNWRYQIYYYDGGWQELHDETYNTSSWAGADDDMYILLFVYSYHISGGTAGTVKSDFDNFHITIGDFSVNEYIQSGQWTSNRVRIPAGCEIENVIITLDGASATYAVDEVEILDASDDSVSSTSTTDITSDGENTVTGWDNPLSGITHDFKIKVYLKGDGRGTCSVTQIDINFKQT